MIKKPFLVINPKNYFNQKELYEMASIADKLAEEYNVTLILTGPFTELYNLKKKTKNILIASQHVDSVPEGTGMGKVSPKALKEIGVDVIVMNHAENRLYFSDIIAVVKECNDLNIDTVVCCDSILEAKALALLDPTVILCEPTELIGTGQTSDLSYVKETNKLIRSISPNILVEQAAGVKNYEDVYKIIKAGSDGTGATSAFVNAEDREALLREMIEAMIDAVKED
ncbi:triose-phosphate isomerase [Maledivibacter halophilus]|uniref:Triosephosphate isomerase n=1 Tax=Maledivibacter halophilus TaxID=36842 RepID=A0A1T5L0S4_9FIRM|nr:triose-phosphate isomerase [Maledivibacter halophilus]SKC69533.1 triosephosphate isomerase [Maledivibacter halophilus]